MAELVLVVGAEDGDERFLRDVDVADFLHALLAFALLVKKLAFTGDIAAVAFGENVFAELTNIFAGDDFTADGALDGDLKHLRRNGFAKTFANHAGACDGAVCMADGSESVNGFAVDENFELDGWSGFVTVWIVIH